MKSVQPVWAETPPKYKFSISSEILTGDVTPLGMDNYRELERLVFNKGHDYFLSNTDSSLLRGIYLLTFSAIGLTGGVPMSIAGHESYGHRRYRIAAGHDSDDIFFKVGDKEYSGWGLIALGHEYAKGTQAVTYGPAEYNPEQRAAIAGAGSLIQTNYSETIALKSSRKQFFPSDAGMYAVNKTWWTFYNFRRDKTTGDNTVHRKALELQGVEVSTSDVRNWGIFSLFASGGTINYIYSWYQYVFNHKNSTSPLSFGRGSTRIMLPEVSTFGRGSCHSVRVTVPAQILSGFHLALSYEREFMGIEEESPEYGIGIYNSRHIGMLLDAKFVINEQRDYYFEGRIEKRIPVNMFYGLESLLKKYGIHFNIFGIGHFADGYTYFGDDRLPGLRRVPIKLSGTIGFSLEF